MDDLSHTGSSQTFVLEGKDESAEQEETDLDEEVAEEESVEEPSEKSTEYEDNEEISPEPSEQQPVRRESSISTLSTPKSKLKGRRFLDPHEYNFVKTVLKKERLRVRPDDLPYDRRKLKKPILLHKPCEKPPGELHNMAHLIGEREEVTKMRSYRRFIKLQNFALFWNDRSEKVRKILNKYK